MLIGWQKIIIFLIKKKTINWLRGQLEWTNNCWHVHIEGLLENGPSTLKLYSLPHIYHPQHSTVVPEKTQLYGVKGNFCELNINENRMFYFSKRTW